MKPLATRTWTWVLVAVALPTAAATGKGGEPWARLEAPDGGGRIVAAAADRVAAESLRSYFDREFHIAAPIVGPDEPPPGNVSVDFVLGTRQTNHCLKKLAADHHIDLASLTEDGYVLRTLRDSDNRAVLVAGGGTPGMFYALGELKHNYLQRADGGATLLAADVREVPVLKYRWFWTWDFRMAWDGNPGGLETGSHRNYKKPPESYVADYKNCIDFMSENGLNGLIIWGFISSKHGGEASAKEICDYAVARGVRVLPGVGTSGYWGYVVDGDHPYHTETWLRQHPELAAQRQTRRGVCPSKKANQDWLDEGAKWLFENFSIGGVNLEMGDQAVCHCEDCARGRAEIQCDYPDYYKDMAISHRVTLQTMRRLASDAWLSYATYTDFDESMMRIPPKFIEMIPEDAICQWNIRGTGGATGTWTARPMARHNIGYLSYVFGGRNLDLFLDRLQAAAASAHRTGMEGLAIYGESPASLPTAGLNYLAFREYCFHPDMTAESFTQKRLAPRYGAELTDDLWRIMELTGTRQARGRSENVSEARALARAALDRAPAHAGPHWEALDAYLQTIP